MSTPETEATSVEPTEEAAAAGATASPTLSHEEALARIHRGELLENVRIVGLRLKGEFTARVCLRNATLIDLEVEKSHFADDVAIEYCTLVRPKFSKSSCFEKGLSLVGSTLVRAALRRITVRGAFRCDHITTKGQFRVESAKFEGRARFWEAQFMGWADFQSCEFLDDADFRSVHADQGFVLTKCTFRAAALFRGMTSLKKWQADGSRFESLLDLSKAKLHDFTYLESIEQGPAQRFAFTNAIAERILVRPEQLTGRLASEETGDYAQAMQEYGLLKRNYEGLHRFEHEDWAFYRFKVNQRRGKTRSWARPWTKLTQFADWLFLDRGCGYGTNPVRAVCAAAVIVLIFAVIYAAGVQALHVDDPPFGDDPTTVANRVMIGALTSVSMFTSGFSDIRGAASGWMNVPLIVESLLGTLLWGLFIVAFSRKVIR